ncbi:cysteine proteinase inhibitor 1-like [Chenopodium quinoa]|uniref:cysteine proteinase inhibitor 1-like n=1 Tax=Chenopodium quinoa TaxID=63459 RepID=UPI000B774065|nr:cysteine proteinase inhibitor 1-like [Chenopodium quinoa]
MSNRKILLIVFSLLAVISAVSAAGKRTGAVLGGYKPIKDINDPYVQEVAKFAVAKHNEEANSHLGIVRIVKGESQVVAGTNYRFLIAADDHQQYETVVYDKPWQHFRSLTYFKKVSA